MGSVFAMQGIGQFAAAMIALIVTSGFKNSLLTAKKFGDCTGVCGLAVDKMWRIVIGFGAVPGCIALYFRLTIPETPRYTFDVARDVEKAGEDVKAYMQGQAEGHPDEIRRAQTIADHDHALSIPQASWNDFIGHYSQWRYGKILLGTAGSWFFLDVAFYGIGLNNSIILNTIGFSGGPNVYQLFRRNAIGNLIIVCAGAIPGYWVTVATVDTIGRKPIQMMGFVVLTILFCIIGFAYHKLNSHALLALFILAQFFFNFGMSPFLHVPLTKARFANVVMTRPQRHHVHCTRRVLPHAIPIDLARNFGGLRKARCHRRAGGHRTSSWSWCAQGIDRIAMAQSRYSDLCPLHALRYLHHATHSRDEAKDP